ncbi:MAG: hypothetical protein M1822_001799 [Bathelium mastoideum]|nr:MAG: hypothetical protein M1822_001799 [Bathelium mastoideum]
MPGSAVIFQDVVKTGLKFMASRDYNLFAYAGVYLFLGLACGLRGTSLPLTYEDRQAILKLASRSNIAEIARDFYRASCHSILQNTSVSDAMHEPKEENLHLFNERKHTVHPKIHLDAGWPECWPIWKNLALAESIKTHTSFEEFPAFLLPRVKNLASIVIASRYNCLRGDGLSFACDYLEDSMLDLSCKPLLADLYMILEAIWNEVEVQDFPKHILLRLPVLFLHRTCLATIADEHSDTHNLSELVCKVIFELQRLAENRIYVLSPLSRALRLAVLCDSRFAKSFPFGQFLVNFCNRPPLPKAEFLLEAATIPLFEQLAGFNQERRYEDYYGCREGYGYACIYDLVNRVSLDPSSARFVFDQLLKPWIHQKDDKLVVNKQKTTLQLQMVLLLVDQVIESASPEHSNEAKHHFDKLMSMLPAEPLPRYRFLIECIMLRIIAKERGLRNELLYILKNCDQSKPKYVVSLIKMAIMAARLETSTGNYVREVTIILVTMVASPKIMIRHEAQWSFPFLWDHAETHGLTEVTENPAFAALNEYIRSLEKYMTPPAGRKLEPLDPVRDMTICNIVQGPFLQLYPPEKERAQAADFELIFADKVQMDGVSAARIPLGKLRTDINVSVDHTVLDSQVEVSERTGLEGEASGDQKQMPIQTKGAAWQANALDSISALQDSASDVRAPVILMASLIQSPHNLGGLSRVAEAFGVAALHVASLTVLTNKEFLATSVSSEQHLNIQETPLKTNKGHASKAPGDLEGLAETLVNLKGDGYKIVGIEQTDQSFLLGSEEAAKLLMDTSEASPDKPDEMSKSTTVINTERQLGKLHSF